MNRLDLTEKMLKDPKALQEGFLMREVLHQTVPIAVSRMLDAMVKRLYKESGDADWNLYGYDWKPYVFGNEQLEVFGKHFKLVLTKKAWGEKYGIAMEADDSGLLRNFIYGIFKNYNHVPLTKDARLDALLDQGMQEPARHSTHWGWYKIAPPPFDSWFTASAMADITHYDFDARNTIGGFYFHNLLGLIQKAAPVLQAYAPLAPPKQ